MSPRSISIKILMLKKGVKNKDLAQLAGVTPSMITQVIHGDKTSKHVQRVIALHLDVSVDRLFPKAA